jgi:hypothetical protein
MYKIINLLTKILEKGFFFSLSLLVINNVDNHRIVLGVLYGIGPHSSMLMNDRYKLHYY